MTINLEVHWGYRVLTHIHMDYVKDNLTLVVPENICKIADQDLGAYDVELDEGLQSAGLTSRCQASSVGGNGEPNRFFWGPGVGSVKL